MSNDCATIDEKDHAPCGFALAGLPVIHQMRRVAELPPRPDTALDRLSATPVAVPP